MAVKFSNFKISRGRDCIDLEFDKGSGWNSYCYLGIDPKEVDKLCQVLQEIKAKIKTQE